MLNEFLMRSALFADGEGGGLLTNLFLRVAFIGAEWVLWVLLLLSFISVGIIVDRFLFFRTNTADDDELATQIPELLRAGDVKGAGKWPPPRNRWPAR